MKVFWSSFLLMMAAEFADKSRIVGLLLATTYSAPWAVFWGMTLGYVLLDGAAVLLGGWISLYIPAFWIKLGSASIFILIGAATFRWGKEVEETGKNWLGKVQAWGPFLVSFAAISVSEFADRTQIAAGTLSAETGQPWEVFLGTILAMAVLNAGTIWLGGRLKSSPQFSTRAVRIAGIGFILAGLFLLVQALARR